MFLFFNIFYPSRSILLDVIQFWCWHFVLIRIRSFFIFFYIDIDAWFVVVLMCTKTAPWVSISTQILLNVIAYLFDAFIFFHLWFISFFCRLVSLILCALVIKPKKQETEITNKNALTAPNLNCLKSLCVCLMLKSFKPAASATSVLGRTRIFFTIFTLDSLGFSFLQVTVSQLTFEFN